MAKSKAPATPKTKEPVKPKAPVKKKDEELLIGLVAIRTAMTGMRITFGDQEETLYLMEAQLRDQLVDLIDQMIGERN